ncbi:MAG: hypothetical protein LBU27_04845 [Candidatus Peribacteria bacterium]|nr:hypothetical protein [Candidatus Peribacteria bacterium]
MAFSKRFIKDMGASEISYNAIFMISSLMIILLGRYIGTNIDKRGYQSRIKISLAISVFSLFFLFAINQLTISTEIEICIAFVLIIVFSLPISRVGN